MAIPTISVVDQGVPVAGVEDVVPLLLLGTGMSPSLRAQLIICIVNVHIKKRATLPLTPV